MLLGRGSKDSDSESNPALPKPEVSSEPSSLFPMHCLFPIWYLSFYFQQRLLPGLNHSHPDLKVSFQSLLTGWNPAPTDRPASWQGPLSRASKVPPTPVHFRSQGSACIWVQMQFYPAEPHSQSLQPIKILPPVSLGSRVEHGSLVLPIYPALIAD